MDLYPFFNPSPLSLTPGLCQPNGPFRDMICRIEALHGVYTPGESLVLGFRSRLRSWMYLL